VKTEQPDKFPDGVNLLGQILRSRRATSFVLLVLFMPERLGWSIERNDGRVLRFVFGDQPQERTKEAVHGVDATTPRRAQLLDGVVAPERQCVSIHKRQTGCL